MNDEKFDKAYKIVDTLNDTIPEIKSIEQLDQELSKLEGIAKNLNNPDFSIGQFHGSMKRIINCAKFIESLDENTISDEDYEKIIALTQRAGICHHTFILKLNSADRKEIAKSITNTQKK